MHQCLEMIMGCRKNLEMQVCISLSQYVCVCARIYATLVNNILCVSWRSSYQGIRKIFMFTSLSKSQYYVLKERRIRTIRPIIGRWVLVKCFDRIDMSGQHFRNEIWSWNKWWRKWIQNVLISFTTNMAASWI